MSNTKYRDVPTISPLITLGTTLDGVRSAGTPRGRAWGPRNPLTPRVAFARQACELVTRLCWSGLMISL